jgi:hypothetical protein
MAIPNSAGTVIQNAYRANPSTSSKKAVSVERIFETLFRCDDEDIFGIVFSAVILSPLSTKNINSTCFQKK